MRTKKQVCGEGDLVGVHGWKWEQGESNSLALGNTAQSKQASERYGAQDNGRDQAKQVKPRWLVFG